MAAISPTNSATKNICINGIFRIYQKFNSRELEDLGILWLGPPKKCPRPILGMSPSNTQSIACYDIIWISMYKHSHITHVYDTFWDTPFTGHISNIYDYMSTLLGVSWKKHLSHRQNTLRTRNQLLSLRDVWQVQCKPTYEGDKISKVNKQATFHSANIATWQLPEMEVVS